MRGLLALVIGMGVLIVLGVGVVGVTIARRLSAPTVVAGTQTLDAPPGTRMLSLAPVGDRLAVLLQGGGPDRVVVFDPRSGQSTTVLTLAR